MEKITAQTGMGKKTTLPKYTKVEVPKKALPKAEKDAEGRMVSVFDTGKITTVS